jgi:solute carrier family 13 (sodium-dependent dicarboxylate transporter), member 2/3/5
MKSSTPAHDWTSANLLAGPLAFGIMLVLPFSSATYPVRCAIGLLLWMTWWWLTRPVHLAVTSFLPLAVGAVFNFVPMANLLHAYSEEMIILLIGANIITTAWTRWGVDRRVGLASALAVGKNPRTQIVVWFLIAAGLSAVLPNTVVAATLIPIVIVMCQSMGIDDIAASPVGTGLVLAVAWGSSVGGFATPLGGAMNLLAMKLVQDSATHHEFFFTTWTTRMLPLTVVLLLVTTAFMAFAFRMRNEGTLHQADLQREWKSLGSWSSGGKWSLLLFGVASALAFTRQLYSTQLPALTPAYSFLACGLACFAIRAKGKPLLDWESATQNDVGTLLFICGRNGAGCGSQSDRCGKIRRRSSDTLRNGRRVYRGVDLFGRHDTGGTGHEPCRGNRHCGADHNFDISAAWVKSDTICVYRFRDRQLRLRPSVVIGRNSDRRRIRRESQDDGGLRRLAVGDFSDCTTPDGIPPDRVLARIRYRVSAGASAIPCRSIPECAWTALPCAGSALQPSRRQARRSYC